jgi:probable rRNA maturation factor
VAKEWQIRGKTNGIVGARMYATPHIQVGKVRSLSPAMRRTLARRLRDAARRCGLAPAQLSSLGVRVVDDAEMTKLHLQYMAEPGPTDVLSFPSDDDAQLGDIAIDWQQVQRQARVRTPQGFVDEATVLLVHGLAHLLGHDHATPGQARAMRALERKLLRAIRVPDAARPYGD